MRQLAALLLAASCVGCATDGDNAPPRAAASTLEVGRDSQARNVLLAVPPEAAMERFGMRDDSGRLVSYVAFTDTEIGALIFRDDRLYGMLSKRDAYAFYSCRGYVSASYYHWARDAGAWNESLFAAAVPIDAVTLGFSGRSTVQSIRAVVNDPLLSDVSSLIGMGSNPLSIISKLSSARSNLQERERFETTLRALNDLSPGDSETRLATIVRPEDMSFTSDGMVLAYPRFSLDFYVNAGVVKVIQQPSFHRLARMQAAIFYQPNLRWDYCNPRQWREALPRDWRPPQVEEESWSSLIEKKPAEGAKPR